MNILVLAHRVPYPPDKGERIRAFHEIQFLADRGHTIDLFCPATSLAEVGRANYLLKWCRTITVKKVRLHEIAMRAVAALGGHQPVSPAFFHSSSLKEIVQQAIARVKYDLIFMNCSSMAQYLPEPAPCPTIVDFVDTDSAKWMQYATRERFPRSWVYRREARYLSALEQKLVRSSAASIVISAKEAEQLSPADPRITVIGNGVSVVDEEIELPGETGSLKPYIVFVGTMNYRPNIDAVTYFSHEIFPLIRQAHPTVSFVIVGRDPAPRVRALSNLPGIEVTGEVGSTANYLKGAHVAVAPFRISQGVHNKILEAMVAGVPVVCTSPPVEGLPAALQTMVTVADDVGEFAAKVGYFLENEPARDRFRDASIRVREELNWDRVLDPLDRIVHDVTGGCGTSRRRDCSWVETVV